MMTMLKLLATAALLAVGTAHAANLDAGKQKAQEVCQACHGMDGLSAASAEYPKLAGQYPDYLYAALKAYQTDHNAVLGRSNAIMMGMARPFKHAEIKALAQYISTLPGDLKTVAQSRFR